MVDGLHRRTREKSLRARARKHAATGALFAAMALAASWLGVPAVAAAQPSAADVPVRRERVYLAQIALTLEGARRLVLWVESYGGDPELARYAYPVADKFVDTVSQLSPSVKWQPAHPHVLLIVENVERALDAASAGDLAAFRQHTRTVREELAILDGLFKQLKLKLPELGR